MLATAEIAWIDKVYDFGAFDEDTKEKLADFKFVNIGSEPVSIVSVTASCGCTVPEYGKEPVAPGDTATIVVKYDPTGRPGRFQKHIFVRTSDSPERFRLFIKGTVIGSPETINGRYPVSVGQLKLRTGAAMMGRVFHGHPKTTYIDGYNQSDDTIRPAVTAVPEYLSVAVTPEAVAPGDMMNFEVKFKGDAKGRWGMVNDSIMIAANPGQPPVAYPVVAIVEDDFTGLSEKQRAEAPVAYLSEEKIVLPVVTKGSKTPVNATIALANKGKSTMTVRRVYSEDPGISVSVSDKKVRPGKSATITVSFDPSRAAADVVNARVTVITDAPDGAMQTVRVVGEIR